MKFWTKRIGNGLYPLDAASMEEFEPVPWHKPLRTEVKQPRNEGFHRLFFALCKRIGSGIGKDTDWVVRAFKLETGHFTVYTTIGGRELIQLESIAFDKMDEMAFRAFVNEAIAIMYTKWGIDPASVADLVVPKLPERTR